MIFSGHAPPTKSRKVMDLNSNERPAKGAERPQVRHFVIGPNVHFVIRRMSGRSDPPPSLVMFMAHSAKTA
jgi:hypothetical protein